MHVTVSSLSVPNRHAPVERGDLVHMSYWIAAVAVALAVVAGLPLGQPTAVAVATIVFIGGGLPHGAYDIALLRSAVALDRSGVALAVGGYLAVAVAMALLWIALPLAALTLFLAVAAVHFGEDWAMLDEPLLRVAAGAAVIAAPTIGHPAEVARLFVAMSDDRAALLAQLVTAAAPVALLVTAVGIAAAWQEGSRHWAGALALCLALLIVAPPVAGFALFFVFLHSPRHLRQTRAQLRTMTRARWFGIGVAMSGAAILGWYALQQITPAKLDPNLTAQAFQLLAAVAVPHLLLSRWVERRLASHEHLRRSSALSGTASL